MKKTLSFLLAFLMLPSFLMLSSCQNNRTEKNSDTSAQTTLSNTTTVDDASSLNPPDPFDYVAPDVDENTLSITLANYVTFGAQRFINAYFFEDKCYVFIPADFDISNTMLYFGLPNKCSVNLDGKSIP